MADIDLVLLDFHLPDTNGVDVLRAMRAAAPHHRRHHGDAARDPDSVRAAIAHGVTQYLVKPFTSARSRAKLGAATASYRTKVDAATAIDQAHVDALLGRLAGLCRRTRSQGT